MGQNPDCHKMNRGSLEGDFEDVFSELRWLYWSNCPLEFRATNLGMKNLAVLELFANNITDEWGGWCQIMVAKQLKVLKLMFCSSLTKTPPFSAISKLEILILTGCTKLRMIDESIGSLQHLDQLKIEDTDIESLPESIGGLQSLTKLTIRSQRLSVLPHSIGNLVKLKHLILQCHELQKLPNSIGQLESLLELYVIGTSIRELPFSIRNLERLKFLKIPNCRLEKLPDSIGRLHSLVKLVMKGSNIKILPDCIGNLKNLKVLKLKGSYISELPKTIGMLENLEELHVSSKQLEREIPSEIGALSLLKILDLSGGLPTTINQLTNLQTLNLWGCDSIQQLPGLPKSLTALRSSLDSLTTIPDFSNLTNIVEIFIMGTSVQEAKIEGLGRLRALRQLTLCVDKMALPPTDFSSLSQLQRLSVRCADSRSLIRLPTSLQELYLEDVQSPIDWSLFSNLENLSSLVIGRYTLGEIRFEALGKLPKLFMSYCPLLETLTILRGLKEIQQLSLFGLPRLTEIHGLGELKSLRALSICECDSIKSLNESDLSNLHNLKRLGIYRCESLESVLGVPKSCVLDISGCSRFNRDG